MARSQDFPAETGDFVDFGGWFWHPVPMRYFLLSLLLLGAPAAAQQACDDVWFTRNLHFDRAGYCFGSALGQAVFDNSDCVGKDITLSPDAKRQVNEIKKLEAFHGCKVDTSRTTIDIADLALRRQLIDLPIRDEFESGCLGWLGTPLPLHAGIGAQNPVMGHIEPGDYVLFSFVPVGDWTYVTTHADNFSGLKTGGWALVTAFPETACTAWAG